MALSPAQHHMNDMGAPSSRSRFVRAILGTVRLFRLLLQTYLELLTSLMFQAGCVYVLVWGNPFDSRREDGEILIASVREDGYIAVSPMVHEIGIAIGVLLVGSMLLGMAVSLLFWLVGGAASIAPAGVRFIAHEARRTAPGIRQAATHACARINDLWGNALDRLHGPAPPQ